MNHQARKRFGQNFLHDERVIQRIVSSLVPQPGDLMVEIGPGMGAITKAILTRTKKLVVVELDRDLIPILKNHCEGLGELIVHEADALKFNFAELTSTASSLRLVGNLPYNISTPLLFHLLTFAPLIKDMLFMLQKEVAERMIAAAGTEDYGRLSVMVQYFCQPEILFLVGPESFRPRPKVESAIIRLVPHATLPVVAKDFKLFADIVREAFCHRRKTLRNSLHDFLTAEQLEQIGIDPQLRAERLTVADFVMIANSVSA